jgi:hypothetical protein
MADKAFAALRPGDKVDGHVIQEGQVFPVRIAPDLQEALCGLLTQAWVYYRMTSTGPRLVPDSQQPQWNPARGYFPTETDVRNG